MEDEFELDNAVELSTGMQMMLADRLLENFLALSFEKEVKNLILRLKLMVNLFRNQYL